MTKIISACAGLALLTACAPGTTVATTVTPATVCGIIATAESNATVQQQLAGISPTSALGVLWADVQSGCVGGTAVAGVSTSWETQVLAYLEALLPSVLPALVGLI
jgi:hypothetical protein